jgi:hypothetical protein
MGARQSLVGLATTSRIDASRIWIDVDRLTVGMMTSEPVPVKSAFSIERSPAKLTGPPSQG